MSRRASPLIVVDRSLQPLPRPVRLDPVTAAAMPPRPRWRVLLLAASTFVLALLLPAVPASATTLPAAETRVGALDPTTAAVVGVHECITAGQRPVRGPSQLQVVSGLCVAAKAGSGRAATAARTCSVNSFTGTTLVTMADGTKKPIRDVKVGDQVLATDPETGETASRPVTKLIVHRGQHTMVDVRLADGSTITATDRHPFWNATTGAFTYAVDLRSGEKVREIGGTLLTIAGTRAYDADVTAYNLTVEGIHTYYVGTTPVLVHNSCGPDDTLYRFGAGPQSAERLAAEAENAVAKGFPYGVSTSSQLPARIAKSGEFGSSTRSAIEQAGLGVEKTGNSPFHYTVTFPRSVDPELAELFNRVFYGGTS